VIMTLSSLDDVVMMVFVVMCDMWARNTRETPLKEVYEVSWGKRGDSEIMLLR
jgi:sulfur transfer complex TusBCD TusB component (DsrH family)